MVEVADWLHMRGTTESVCLATKRRVLLVEVLERIPPMIICTEYLVCASTTD